VLKGGRGKKAGVVGIQGSFIKASPPLIAKQESELPISILKGEQKGDCEFNIF
jgi:hypothetical protein